MKRFDSFKRCLWDFSKCKHRDYKNDTLVLSGIIAKFNMTFDLSWKVLKDIMTDYHGLSNCALGSPRENLEAAFRCGIIEDNEIWIEMLKLRNRLAHDYNSELAYETCDKIVNFYLKFFIDFEKHLTKYLSEIKE